MSVALIAAKHGLAVARVSTETDDYARLVRSTTGRQWLLSIALSAMSKRLREVLEQVLLSNKIRIVRGSSSAIEMARNIFASLDELCANPPKYRLIEPPTDRDFYVIADSSTDMDIAIRRSLSDQRFISELQKSDVAEDVTEKIERLKQLGLI